MVDISKDVTDFVREGSERAKKLSRSPRWRRFGIAIVVVLLIFTLFGVFGVPPILRHVLTGPVAASLHRPVTVGRISFNPFRLLLNVDQLHIGDRDGSERFVDLGHLRVKASWSSILHLAPVLHDIELDRPMIHIVRTADQEFNFSDLIVPSPPSKPGTPPSKPFRFAISNIQLRDGDITLDDKVLGQQHKVEHIRIGVPFIANLPSAVDVSVQPLLAMVIDGSPLHLTGRAKPFAVPMESVLDLNIHDLDLSHYIGYVPRKLPIKLPSGMFSCLLQIHFVNDPTRPIIKIAGAVSLDKIDVRDEANSPLVGLGHFVASLNDVEPLDEIVHLGKIRVRGLSTEVVRKADGTTNFTALAGPPPPPPAAAQATPAVPQAATTPIAAAQASTPAITRQAAPPVVAAQTGTPAIASPAITPSVTPAEAPPSLVSAPAAATPAATAAAEATPAPDISVDSFELADSSIHVTDNSGPSPAVVELQGIHINLTSFHTIGGGPAPYDIAANLAGGGAIGVKGLLDLTQKQVTSNVSIDQVDLPALQPFAQSVLAGTIASGKLNIHANVQTNFGTNFNVHAEPAGVSLDNLKINSPDGETPVQWKSFGVDVGQVDLATHSAKVTQVHAEELRLFVKRGRKGDLNLLSLARTSTSTSSNGQEAAASTPSHRTRRSRRSRHSVAAAPSTPSHPATPVWQYTVESAALENSEVQIQDETQRQPVKIAIAPLNLHVKDVGSDLSKPFTLDLDAIFNQKGSLKVTGTTAVDPLKANLRIVTRRLDLSFADPYLAKQLNATIKSAGLTMNGTVALAKVRDDVAVNYRGDATLGNVRMQDRVTGDNFVRWSALSVSRIDAGLGKHEPKVHIGGIALSNFYARVILDRSGRLNLSDITTNPQERPKSLTREQTPVVAQAATPTPTATVTPAQAQPVATPVPHPINADIELSRITLQGGHINYTDNFIQPNYTADLTDIGGKIGAFGTRTTTPADVTLQGQVNGSAPVSINGSINPLVPMAFLDIGAKADGIELTNLTPYSTKYTGYPIIKGTLNLDVHYLLDKGNLTANNHIVIDQFTFGDRVESKDATNLPVRLAVALLKNSKGQIDLTVPVSGSLSDPQFSIGGVIWQTFKNLILRAATSPFSLIASAFGGGNGQDLGYVEFNPGYAKLTPDSVNKLTTVAKALKDRTGLRLGIAGRVDPAVDREGLRDAKVDQLVEAEAEDSGINANTKLSSDQYDKYLKRVYKAAKFPKPRDFVGINKTLPSDEMKKLLITNTEVSDQDLKHLADARANVVREWMSKQIDPARLFVTTPQLDAKGVSDKGKSSRVDLSLQ